MRRVMFVLSLLLLLGVMLWAAQFVHVYHRCWDNHYRNKYTKVCSYRVEFDTR